MQHGEKTLIFFKELENLYKKHNLQLAYDPDKGFCVTDLNGEMNLNWRDFISDYSINKIEQMVTPVETPSEDTLVESGTEGVQLTAVDPQTDPNVSKPEDDKKDAPIFDGVPISDGAAISEGANVVTDGGLEGTSSPSGMLNDLPPVLP